MNHEIERNSRQIAGGAPWGAVPCTADGVAAWSEQAESKHDLSVRLEERRRERMRIARELHDTLLQSFLGVSMLLQNTVDSMPPDAPERGSLSRALHLMRRAIDEGREAVRGLRSPESRPDSLEKAFADLGEELAPGRNRLRISVMGRPQPLNPTIIEQIYFIGREALVNALRHSEAPCIEAEIEYLPSRLRLVVRDNGCGIDEGVLQAGRNSHWGLAGMHERANNIGAQLRIWSRKGAGTEVEVSVPGCSATAALA